MAGYGTTAGNTQPWGTANYNGLVLNRPLPAPTYFNFTPVALASKVLSAPASDDLVVQDAVHDHVSQQLAEHYLDATVGTASTPDAPEMTLQNTHGFLWKASPPTTMPAALATHGDAANNLGWSLSRQKDDGNNWYLLRSSDGISFSGLTWLLSPTRPVGIAQYHAYAQIINDGSNNNNRRSYQSSDDGATYTQVGSINGAASTWFDTTGPVVIGKRSNVTWLASNWDGRIHWIEFRNGGVHTDPKSGTLVWRFDAADHVSGTSWVGAVDGRTWTLTSALAVVHQAAAPDITLFQVAAINLVVQDAAHAFVAQPDTNAFLNCGPSFEAPTNYTASTPDPGPLPATGFVFVTKAWGPISSTAGLRLGLLGQTPTDGNRSHILDRTCGFGYVRLTAYPAGTTAGAVNVHNDTTLQAVDATKAEYWAAAYNSTTGAWRTLASPDSGASYTQIVSGTGTPTGFFDSTGALTIGGEHAASARWGGWIYWVELRTGNDPLAGTLLWRFDPSEHVSGTGWTDARGTVWTTSNALAIIHPTTDTPTLTQTTSTNIVVADGLHAHTAANTVLVVDPAVQDATHAHTAANVALDVVLVVQAATHAHTADSATLNYVVLAPAAATHAHVADNVALDVVLVVAAATHAHVADAVTLNYVVLAPADAVHAHTAANVALGVDITVQAATHAHTADNVVTNYVVLAPANAAHAHTADNVAIGVNITVAAATHAHTGANVVLDAAVTLVVANATHAHVSGYGTGAAPTPVVYADNFNRADGVPGSGWAHGVGSFTIASNRLARSSGDGSDFARFTQDIGSPDMFAEADVYHNGASVGGGGNPYACLNVREDSSFGQNTYMGYYNPTGEGGFGSTWSIGKMQGGSFSSVAYADATGEGYPTPGSKIRLEVQGSALRLYLGAVLKVSTTDTSITTGNYAGVNCNYVTPPATFDNFTAGPIAATVPTALFTEDWNTADDTHWDWAKWPTQTPFCPIVSGQGSVPASGGPSEVFSDTYVTDFEMTVKLTWTSSIAGMYPEVAWRIYDGIGGFTAASGYVIQITGSNGRVDIFKVGGYTSIGNITDASLSAAGSRWFKIRAVGNNHKVKWWNDGSGEPGTWQLDATDASPPNDNWGKPVIGGAIGFRNYTGNAYLVDDLTVTNLGTDYGPDGSIRTLNGGKISINGVSNMYPTDTDLSWCCWFKTTDGSFLSTTSIMGLFVGGSSTYCITLISTAGILVQNLDDGNFSTGYAWPVDTWVFVAMSRSITGGTDLYYAPQGTPTLTKTHSTHKGTVTGLMQWLMSDDYSSSPYAQGAAFKIWKAALTQADFTAEMSYYSAQRTANLFASYPMRNGMYYQSENPVNNTLDLWWAQGGLVSGPTLTHLLDAPALPPSGVIDVPLIINLSVDNAFHAITDVAGSLPKPNDCFHAVTSDNVTLITAIDLVVANSLHAHTATNIAVGVDLVVNPAAHAHIADNVALGINITVQAALHAHTADAPTLYAVPMLVVAAAVHAHVADNSALGVDITVQGAVHAHTADAPTLNYVVLAVADAAHLHTSVSPTLVVDPAVQSATHAHTAANVDLVVDLAVQSANHQHVADNLTVAGAGDLIVQGALHQHLADNVTPLNINMDGVQSAVHAHTAANVVVEYNLAAVQNALQAHTADNAILTPGLLLADALHAHTAGNVDLTLSNDLVVANATHTTIDNLTLLTQVHNLTVAAAAQAITDLVAPLTQLHVLTVDSALHAHTATQVSLAGGSSLLVADALQASTSDVVSLTQDHFLVVAPAAHAVTSDAPALYPVPLLVVNDGIHVHTATVLVLYAVPDLVVNGALHAHSVASPTLTQAHFLALDPGFHAHSAGNLVLIFGLSLVTQSALHLHYADGDLDVSDATVLGNADALYLGLQTVDRIYQGAVQVWP